MKNETQMKNEKTGFVDLEVGEDAKEEDDQEIMNSQSMIFLFFSV